MRKLQTMTTKRLPLLAVAAASVALAGCVSLGASDPPESLLTLSSTTSAPAGSGATTGGEGSAGAIAVYIPEVPAKLDVVRVPVQVSDTSIAYLQEAVWVEKPARLFRRLLGETLRTRSGEQGAMLVLDTGDTPVVADRYVRGTLMEMGYDARSGDVVVQFEAIKSGSGNVVESRRFEAREEGIAPEAAAVGPALNRAANRVAAEVADWVMGAG